MTLPAPQIAGHRHLRLLSGAGGYGDVHLYEEIALGGRKVAVKVIREDDPASPAARQFLAEANTMAALEHPNIVRVYGSGTTADGRPYISMQYCAGDTFEQRVLHERLSLAEVLRTGVGVGSAVETAHRAGLLHRDIKPANILKTPWGSPGLTDFGVAHQMSAEEVSEDVGVSVPWSPPEMLYTSTNGSPASDVYSLAATLWHLLVGRPPFTVPGGDNGTLATMTRIRDLAPPSTGRPDVPESLERVLRQAMAKRPEQRPRTMAEFIRNLQSVEAEQRLQVSEAVVIDAEPHVHEVPPHLRTSGGIDARPPTPSTVSRPSTLPSGIPNAPGGIPEGGTVIRARPSGSSVSPPVVGGARGLPREDALGSARTQRRPAGAPDGAGAGGPRDERRSSVGHEAGTVLRPRVTTVDVAAGPDPRAQGRTRSLLIGGGVVALGMAAILGVILLGRGGDGSPTPTASALSTTDAGGGEDVLPPGPVRVKASRADGQVTFNWDYSAALDTDEYRWQVVGGATGTSKDPTATVPASSDAPVCLEVIVVRLDGSNATTEWSQPGCS